jgi:hypothetical protein
MKTRELAKIAEKATKLYAEIMLFDKYTAIFSFNDLCKIIIELEKNRKSYDNKRTAN